MQPTLPNYDESPGPENLQDKTEPVNSVTEDSFEKARRIFFGKPAPSSTQAQGPGEFV